MQRMPPAEGCVLTTDTTYKRGDTSSTGPNEWPASSSSAYFACFLLACFVSHLVGQNKNGLQTKTLELQLWT